MEQQILDAPSDVGKKLDYAGFWIRVGAVIIDGVILQVLNVALAFIIVGSYDMLAPSVSVQILSAVLGILYYIGMESSSRQATLGKMAVGIKVGKANGERISFLNATGRYFAKIISVAILLIGYIMVAFDSKKQGLHDKLANTYVYYG
jgi:uncharacterized RDD family membrane protein YckC